MDPTNPVMCTNCKQTTDASGQVVWICEHCGSENSSHPASVIAVTEPTPDAAAAQAAINAVLPNPVSK